MTQLMTESPSQRHSRNKFTPIPNQNHFPVKFNEKTRVFTIIRGWRWSKWWPCISHFFNNWFPYSPWLPYIVENFLFCGIGAERLLKDTLKYERKLSSSNCWGNNLDKLLWERFNACQTPIFLQTNYRTHQEL